MKRFSLSLALPLVLGLIVAACGQTSQPQASAVMDTAGDSARLMTFKGTLSYGASTDWNPPASYSITLGENNFWWLDLDTNGLAEQGRNYIASRAVVLATGYATVKGEAMVFVATSLRAYVQRADAPTADDCSYGSDLMGAAYPDLFNGHGVGGGSDGECAVILMFETEANHNLYVSRRESRGQRPDLLVFQRNGRTVRIELVREVVGTIIANPTIGVTN